jgi:glucuronoarabinoxylan endo-1,4-beta-xylanase
MQIYVETTDEDSTMDFFIDDVYGAVKGTKIDGPSVTIPTQGNDKVIPGDANYDGRITAADAAIIRRCAMNTFSGAKNDAKVAKAADVNGDGEVTVADLTQVYNFLLGRIKKFSQSDNPVTTTQSTTQTTASVVTTTTSGGTTPSGGGDLMKQIANDMKTSAPNGFNTKRAGVDYGKVEKKTYQSKDGGGTKSINVILPAGYSTSKKYPVFYVLHGIGGNEDSMVQMGMQTMLGNLLADGLCEPMIIVSCNMVTGGGGGNMFSQEFMRHNDLIREDIKNSIMPYMEQNYSVATGRENTAISGFSLGGREALYTGITNSELYGYVGGACPAPGIFPTTDTFMTHEGSLKQESQFKPSVMPNLILISAAANDNVVGTYPESYHKALQNNGVEHLWNVIPQGDHGNQTVEPHMYNFMRYLFK